MTATPASRAVRWAKDHGRPMDSTVIEAYLKGWNAGIRSTRHLRADQVAAHSNAFAMYQQAGLVTKQNDQLLAQNAALQDELDLTRAGLEFAKDAAFKLSGVAAEKYSKSDVEAICSIALAASRHQRDARCEQMEKALHRIGDPDFCYSTDDDEDTRLSLRMADARAALKLVTP